MNRFLGIVFIVTSILAKETLESKVVNNIPGLREVLEIADHPEVERVVEVVIENYEFLEACHETVNWSMNFTACERLLEDFVSLKDFLFTAAEDILYVAKEAEELEIEFTACATKPILKQIKCYKSVITAAESFVRETETEGEGIAEDGIAILKQIKSDVSQCFDKGLSSDHFEMKIRQCRLKTKNN